MEELKIVDFIEKYKRIVDEAFITNMVSSFKLKSMLELNEWETEGLMLIDKTIPYINKILDNPNRIIENVGDVVNIELAKKITPESIKHLGVHTNLIQSADKKTNEITPSKILNIEKVENFLTYENRLIYTLIQHILFFTEKSKKTIENIQVLDVNLDKDLNFKATAKDQGEDININLHISTQMDRKTLNKKIEQKKQLIKEIEVKTNSLKNTPVYEIMDNVHVKEIVPPVKKTNLILKNVNFNYAMKLWDYLQENLSNFDKESNREKEENQLSNKAMAAILNELAFVDYMILKKYKEIESETAIINEIRKNKEISSLNEQDINRIVLNQIKKGDFKNYMVEQQIKSIFLQEIDKYCKQIKKTTNKK